MALVREISGFLLYNQFPVSTLVGVVSQEVFPLAKLLFLTDGGPETETQGLLKLCVK